MKPVDSKTFICIQQTIHMCIPTKGYERARGELRQSLAVWTCLPPPFRGEGGEKEAFLFGEKPVEASHARLAWPWASQATAHGRLQVPAVLATRVPWAREWAAGCARGRRALAHRSMRARIRNTTDALGTCCP